MKKIQINPETNLLEIDPYNFTLQNVTEPNLFREIFSYDTIPKTPFNHRKVPENMPSKIWITDTTFRDGQQSREPFSVKDIVEIYKLEHKLGGKKGIIRQSEFFAYTKKDQESIYKCLELGYKYPEITTWIRARKEDYELIKSIGVKESGVLVSCSDYHIFKKLNMNREQAMSHYLKIIYEMINNDIIPRCHFEDVTRADFYGFVIPFATKLMELSKESGVPIKIRLCDTMGYGLPYSGIALPRSVPGIIYGLQHHARVPSELLEWHGHNDFYKGVANATIAWIYGASSVNCSVLGIGERTGNIPLEAMVIEYASIRGTFDGMQPTVITEIAEYFENNIGYNIPPMTPYVGKNFNTTRAGVHADGLLKDEEIYNIFDTGKILNRPPRVSISNTSGLAGIAKWINVYFDIPKEKEINKDNNIVVQLKKWVDKQYDEGRTTEISENELLDYLSCNNINILELCK